MENNTYLVSGWPYSRESPIRMASGVTENPLLEAGLLLGYLLLGLVSFLWAFFSQRSRLNVFGESIALIMSFQQGSLVGVQNVHYTLLSLLFMNVLNAITAIILAVSLINAYDVSLNIVIVTIVWFLSKNFGLIFHLQTALVSVLHLSYPQWGAKLRIVTTVVSLVIIVIIPIYIFFSRVATFLLAAVMFVLALAIIGKCISATVSPSVAIWKKWIVFVSMFTLFVICLPNFVLQCLLISAVDETELNKYANVYMNVLFGTNIQLFLDGLLCFFILKLPSEEERQQQEEEQNLENPHYNIHGNA